MFEARLLAGTDEGDEGDHRNGQRGKLAPEEHLPEQVTPDRWVAQHQGGDGQHPREEHRPRAAPGERPPGERGDPEGPREEERAVQVEAETRGADVGHGRGAQPWAHCEPHKRRNQRAEQEARGRPVGRAAPCQRNGQQGGQRLQPGAQPEEPVEGHAAVVAVIAAPPRCPPPAALPRRAALPRPRRASPRRAFSPR